MDRNYSTLITFKTFEERFEYLKEANRIASIKFGHRRFLNQSFYNSYEWRQTRNKVILRDNGCDLAMPGYKIAGTIYVHHINEVTEMNLLDNSELLLDPENLVCVSYYTHYAITYGDSRALPKMPTERTKFDTCPWRIKNG